MVISPTSTNLTQSILIDLLLAKSLLDLIFRDYGVSSWTYIKLGDEYCERNGLDMYYNRCCVVGRLLIFIGLYDNPSLMLIGGLHLLGHILTDVEKLIDRYGNSSYFCLAVLNEAWNIAFKIATDYHIFIADLMVSYRDLCLETYREHRPNLITLLAFRLIDLLKGGKTFSNILLLFEELLLE